MRVSAALTALLLGAVILIPSPSLAASTRSDDEKATGSGDRTQVDRNDLQKVVCKTRDETGSRLRKAKICKTRQEWDDTQNSGKKMLDGHEREIENLVFPKPP